MADDLWYYEKDGQQHGPVSQDELQALIERGEISRDNLAWTPGQRDWVETGSFEFFLPAFKTPPPVKPAPPPLPPPGPPGPPPLQKGTPGPAAADPTKPAGSSRLKSSAVFSWNALEWWANLKWRAAVITMLTAILVLLILVVEGVLPPTPPQTQPAPTRLHGVRVPVGYTGPVGQIKIDSYPPVELVALRNGAQKELAVPGSQATPMVLLVPPGSYEVKLEKGLSCQVEVSAEQSRTCMKITQTVDAASYYREVGW